MNYHTNALQKQAPEQLCCIHMVIEEMRLLVCKSIYWIAMNADVENVKQKLDFHEIPQ